MGIVPAELDGAVVSNDFPLFQVDSAQAIPAFLGWLCRTKSFVKLCQQASEGTTNRVRLKEERFLALEVPLPPPDEQERIVERIEELARQIQEVRKLRHEQEGDLRQMLLSGFYQIVTGAVRKPMREVAPLVRRSVKVDPASAYPELGIRSFGKGTFRKPALTGLELGAKRIFQIEPGDLLFSNVFAWEGAIAIVKPEDAGRFGSHRFITCVPKDGIATSKFLCFYFLTDEGLEQVQAASPGGAGRNRTLGLEALARIEVPVPSFEAQQQFDVLQAEVDELKCQQAETTADLDALLPAILDRAFKGEL